MKATKNSIYTILLLIFSLTISFFISEISVRYFLPQLTYSDLLLLTGEQYIAGDFIPFTLKPNYSSQMPSMEFPGEMVTIKTNSLGLRGHDFAIEKPDNIKRILLLGDSYTFGVYCNNDQIYADKLEHLCNHEQHKKVEVINAGYADGWSPDEHYAWLINRGIKFSPDIVIYGFFSGNDIVDIDRSSWDEIDKRGLPARVRNPNISIDAFGRIHSKEKDSKTIGHELIYRIPILREIQSLILFNRAISKIVRIFNKEDIINNDWGNNPFEPILFQALSEENREKEELFIKLIEGMKDVSNSNGAEFLLLMIPVNFQVEPNEFLNKVLGSEKFKIQRDFYAELEPKLQQMSIENLNLLTLMKAHPDEKFYPRNGEVHFNSNGHEFTAKELYKKLINVGWLN